MSTANRVQLAQVTESTLGTTPTTPRMRGARFTGESLALNQEFVDSDEIRSDRMLGDPIKIMVSSQGGKNIEISFPVDGSPESNDLRSAFYNNWNNANFRDNDGTADSVITDIGTTTDTAVCTTGTAFVAGQLVRFSGNTNSTNDGVRKCTTGSATAPVFASSGFVADTAPAATSRMKVVGFVGASGDITATASGLGSTSLNFTTLGLVPGMWIKVGGTAAGDKFATAVLNDWMRISGTITATAIPLDNRPSGWTTDAGTGKTIKVWVPDYINNGTTQVSQSIERGFLDQTVPTYIVNVGMVVDTIDVTMTSKSKLTAAIAYKGMGGSQGTVALDASIDANTTGQVMAANANVGRIGEAGSQIISPNWAKELKFQINNNNRQLEAVDSTSPVGINSGECTVTGSINTYFGDNALLTKFYNGTASSISSRVAKNSQALIWQFPRVTYKGDGNPQATGKNTDVMLPLQFTASIDTVLTNKAVWLDRFEYYEA